VFKINCRGFVPDGEIVLPKTAVLHAKCRDVIGDMCLKVRLIAQRGDLIAVKRIYIAKNIA
jgi:CTP-dependent riboflavin kinase